MSAIGSLFMFLVVLTMTPTLAFSQSPVTLTPIGERHCQPGAADACNRDAIVFVHGIYGADETFRNSQTGFDWPLAFSNESAFRHGIHPFPTGVDVFQLSYRTKLIAWARDSNPSFKEIAMAFIEELKPLRVSGYRSIGFIAHSLGGNIVSTYIHEIKSKLGHPQRSQHAFVVTLATPVLGSQVADMAGLLKSILGMNDDLLNSLRQGNLYLDMLEQFRELEVEKEARYRCRQVNLHAAVETKYLGPLLIVSPDSAARPISTFVKSPIVGFPVNHTEIAKPRNAQDGIYRWVLDRVREEYWRLNTWQEAHEARGPDFQLCDRMALIPETP